MKRVEIEIRLKYGNSIACIVDEKNGMDFLSKWLAWKDHSLNPPRKQKSDYDSLRMVPIFTLKKYNYYNDDIDDRVLLNIVLDDITMIHTPHTLELMI